MATVILVGIFVILASAMSLTHDTPLWWTPSAALLALGTDFAIHAMHAEALAAGALALGAFSVVRRLRAVETHV